MLRAPNWKALGKEALIVLSLSLLAGLYFVACAPSGPQAQERSPTPAPVSARVFPDVPGGGGGDLTRYYDPQTRVVCYTIYYKTLSCLQLSAPVEGL